MKNQFKFWNNFKKAYLVGLILYGFWAIWRLFETFIMGNGSPSETMGQILTIPIANLACAVPLFILMFVIHLIRNLSKPSIDKSEQEDEFNAEMDKKFPSLKGMDHAKLAKDFRKNIQDERREIAKRINEVRIKEGLEPWDPKFTEKWIKGEISAFDEIEKK